MHSNVYVYFLLLHRIFEAQAICRSLYHNAKNATDIRPRVPSSLPVSNHLGVIRHRPQVSIYGVEYRIYYQTCFLCAHHLPMKDIVAPFFSIAFMRVTPAVVSSVAPIKMCHCLRHHRQVLLVYARVPVRCTNRIRLSMHTRVFLLKLEMQQYHLVL